MATIPGAPARAVFDDQRFMQRMMLGLAVFILFGFGQFAARGLVDYRAVPIWFHLHGAAMTCWLALSVAQSTLAGSADLSLHRKLGWLATGFVAAIVAFLALAVRAAFAGGITPPFFTPAYFLCLTSIGISCFVALVAAAVIRRRRTLWHARLLVGANVLLMEPALGRLLPMPLTGGVIGEWLAMAVQLVPLALLARHDRKFLGQVHPATMVAAAVLVAEHTAITLLAMTPLAAGLAKSLTV